MRLAFWKKKDSDKPKKKKPVWREWLDAAVFAIVAATLIRTFLIEAYTIPTGSMQNSLLINDYLFVSKLSYGPRVPMTPVAVPLVHNSIFGMKSYTDAVHWKYRRIHGFGHVERYDVVVFNYPCSDTMLVDAPEYQDDYYTAVLYFNNNRDAVRAKYEVITHPVDKEENYIKRCVGLPGDSIQVIDAVLYVNGKPANTYPHQKLSYYVQLKPNAPGNFQDYVDDNELEPDPNHANSFFLENKEVEALKKEAMIMSVKANIAARGEGDIRVFPHDLEHYNWNHDNYGPIFIPKAGTTVTLTPANIALYRRVILNYEGNTFEEKKWQIHNQR